MKLRIERERLLEALATTARAAGRPGGAGPSAGGVRVKTKGDRVQLVGFSPELTIEDRFEVPAAADGVAVLPARLFLDVVRSFPAGADIDITVEGCDAEVVCGRSHFTIRTMPAGDFPEPPRVPPASASFETAGFASALRQVLPAASNDPTRPLLASVLLSAEETGLRLVATDSYRLALRDLPGASVLTSGQSVILPAQALSEVVRLLGVAETATLRLGDADAHFEIGSVRLSTRPVVGNYPAYKALLPDSVASRLVVAKEHILGALSRTRIMCSAPGEPVALELSEAAVRVRTAGPSELGSAGEDIDGRYSGPEMTVGLRADFMATAVEAVDADTVAIGFGGGPLAPVVVEAPGPGPVLQRSLVMPTRLG